MSRRKNKTPQDWRIEATERARAALHRADLQACLWQHLAQVADGLVRTRRPIAEIQRTKGRDRQGTEFWAVSSLNRRLTLVLLPEEL